MMNKDKKNDKGLTKEEYIAKAKATHGDKIVCGEYIWRAPKQPQYVPDRVYEKVTMFPKIVRDSSAIFEEKIDGSNFCFVNRGNGMHFYSRNQELDINNPSNKFYKPFMEMLIAKNKEKAFEKDTVYFGEAVGMAQIPYWKGEAKTPQEKLFIFDAYYSTGIGWKSWLTRKELIEFCDEHDLQIVPEIKIEELDDTSSKIDPNVHREGFIELFERPNGDRWKIKHVEYDLKKHGYQPSLSVHFNKEGLLDTKKWKQKVAEKQKKLENREK